MHVRVFAASLAGALAFGLWGCSAETAREIESSESEESDLNSAEVYPVSAWTLTWSDEFNGANGSAPDPTKWTYDIGNSDGWGNNEPEYYTNTRANSYMENGSLVIEARKNDDGHKYSSARLKTQGLFSQKYGRFEARIKVPSGSALWPAFWMMGADFDQVDWPACGEIDVMENWGYDPSVVEGTVHFPGANAEDGVPHPYTLSRTEFSDNYHVFAVEWESKVIRFYVDGNNYHCVLKKGASRSRCGSATHIARQPSEEKWIFNKPFFMILNLAIDSTSYAMKGEKASDYPAKMLVDYVRVYQAE